MTIAPSLSITLNSDNKTITDGPKVDQLVIAKTNLIVVEVPMFPIMTKRDGEEGKHSL